MPYIKIVPQKTETGTAQIIEHEPGFQFSIRRLDISDQDIKNLEAQAPGNGTIIGRMPVVYTKQFTTGPFLLAGTVAKGFHFPAYLPPGAYRVDIHRPGFETAHVMVNTSNHEEEQASIKVVLEPQFSPFALQLQNQHGEPVKQAQVRLNSLNYEISGITNDQGSFQVNIPSDHYNLAVIGGEKNGNYFQKSVVAKPSEPIKISATVTKFETGVTIVKFIRPNGRPLVGSDVDFKLEIEETPSLNDSEFQPYTFIMSPHRYTQEAEKKALAFLQHDQRQKHIDDLKLKGPQTFLVAGPGAPGNEFSDKNLKDRLSEGAPSSGDFHFGRQVNEVEKVSIFEDRLEDTFGQTPKDSFIAVTDGNGQVEVSSLKEGTYQVKVRKNGILIGQYRIHVKAGFVLERSILIEGTTIPVSLLLYDEEGEPVHDALCYLESLPATEAARSSKVGGVTFHYVNEGSHKAICEKNGFETLRKEFSVAWAEIQRDEGESRASKIKKIGSATMKTTRVETRVVGLEYHTVDSDNLLLPMLGAQIIISPETSGIAIEADETLPGAYRISGLRIDKKYQVEMLPQSETLARIQVMINPELALMNSDEEAISLISHQGIDVASVAEKSMQNSAEARRFYAQLGSLRLAAHHILLVSRAGISISGTIINEEGDFVSDAEVTASSMNQNWVTKTNEEGKIIFKRLPFETGEDVTQWEIEIEHPAYISTKGKIISAGLNQYELEIPKLKRSSLSSDSLVSLDTLFKVPFKAEEIKFENNKFIVRGDYQIGLENLPDFVFEESFNAEVDWSIVFDNIDEKFIRALHDMAFYFRSKNYKDPVGAVLDPQTIGNILKQKMPNGIFGNDMKQNLEQVIALKSRKSALPVGKSNLTLFNAGAYDASMQSIRIEGNGTVESTRLEVNGFTLRVVEKQIYDITKAKQILPEELNLVDVKITESGFDLSNIKLAAGTSLQMYVDGLGEIIASTSLFNIGAQIEIDPKTFDIRISNAVYRVPGVLTGHNDAAELKALKNIDTLVFRKDDVLLNTEVSFSIFPGFELNTIQFSGVKNANPLRLPLAGSLGFLRIPGFGGGVAAKSQITMGMPYQLETFEFNIQTREIITSGHLDILSSRLQNCNGDPIRFGIDELRINFGNAPNLFGAIQMSKSPASFNLFGGTVSLEYYDLQIAPSAWQLQGDAYVAFDGGLCSEASPARGGFLYPLLTIGYTSNPNLGQVGGWYVMDNTYKQVAPNQRMNMKGIGIQVNNVNFTTLEDGTTRMDINGPAMISLGFIMVEATNLKFWNNGKFLAEQFRIRIPVLWNASGMLNWMHTGGVSGNIKMQFFTGQFDFQFVMGTRNWSISLQIPYLPGFPMGGFSVTNGKVYVAKREKDIYIMFGGDLDLGPMGSTASIDSLVCVVDTSGLIQVSGTVQLGGKIVGNMLSGLEASGTVKWAPANEAHITLRMDLQPSPLMNYVIEQKSAGANLHIKFKDPEEVLIGAGVSLRLKPIEGNYFAAGLFFGLNKALPPGFSYDHAVKSPDLVGDHKLYGLYVMGARGQEFGFKAGPASVFVDSDIAFMAYLGLEPKGTHQPGIKLGLLYGMALYTDLEFAKVSFGAQLKAKADGGLTLGFNQGAVLDLGMYAAGKFYIKIVKQEIAVGAEIKGRIRAASGEGFKVYDPSLKVYAGSPSNVPDVVVPKFNVKFEGMPTKEELKSSFKDIGSGFANAAHNFKEMSQGMCLFSGQESCWTCMQRLYDCSSEQGDILLSKVLDRVGPQEINDIIENIKEGLNTSTGTSLPTDTPAKSAVADDESIEMTEPPKIEYTNPDDLDADEEQIDPALFAMENPEMGTDGGEAVNPDRQKVEKWGKCVMKGKDCQLLKGVVGHYLLAVQEGTGFAMAEIQTNIGKCSSYGKKKAYVKGSRDARCADDNTSHKNKADKDTPIKSRDLYKFSTVELERKLQFLNAQLITLNKQKKSLAELMELNLKASQKLIKDVNKFHDDTDFTLLQNSEVRNYSQGYIKVLLKETNRIKKNRYVQSERLKNIRKSLHSVLKQTDDIEIEIDKRLRTAKIKQDKKNIYKKKQYVWKLKVENHQAIMQLDKQRKFFGPALSNCSHAEIKIKKFMQQLNIKGEFYTGPSTLDKVSRVAAIPVNFGKSKLKALANAPKSIASGTASMMNNDPVLLAQQQIFVPVSSNVNRTGPGITALTTRLSAFTDPTQASAAVNALDWFYINIERDGEIAVEFENPAFYNQVYKISLQRREACPMMPVGGSRIDHNKTVIKVDVKEADAGPREKVLFTYKNDNFNYICLHSRKTATIQVNDSGDRTVKNTWFMREIAILEPGRTYGTVAGISQSVTDYVASLMAQLDELNSTISMTWNSIVDILSSGQTGYEDLVVQENWSTLLLELYQDPKKRVDIITGIREKTELLGRNCQATFDVTEEVLNTFSALHKSIVQDFGENKIDQISQKVNKASAVCDRLESLNQALIAAETMLDPPQLGEMNMVGGLPSTIAQIYVDEATKELVIFGVHHVSIQGIPGVEGSTVELSNGTVDYPFEYRIPLPADILTDINQGDDEVTKLLALEALVSMIRTTAFPQAALEGYKGSEQEEMLNRIREVLGLVQIKPGSMVDEFLMTLKPVYSVPGQVKLAEIGPYTLYAENLSATLKGLKYVPKVEKAYLVLERNPATLFGYPLILPDQLMLNDITIVNGELDFTGDYLFDSSRALTMNNTPVGALNIDKKTEIKTTFPTGVIEMKNISNSFDDKVNGLIQRYVNITVQIYPFRVLNIDIPGFQDSSGQMLETESIFGMEVVLDHVRYDKAANKFQIQGNIFTKVNQDVLTGKLKIPEKVQLPFAWSKPIPSELDLNEEQRQAMHDILKYIRTKENSLLHEDQVVYSLEEGLNLLNMQGKTGREIVEEFIANLLGNKEHKINLCKETKMGAVGPYYLNMECPVLITDGSVENTVLEFSRFWMQKKEGLSSMLYLPEIVELKNVSVKGRNFTTNEASAIPEGHEFYRANGFKAELDFSNAIAEVREIKLAHKLGLSLTLNRLTFNFADATMVGRGQLMILPEFMMSFMSDPDGGMDERDAELLNELNAEGEIIDKIELEPGAIPILAELSLSPHVCLTKIDMGGKVPLNFGGGFGTVVKMALYASQPFDVEPNAGGELSPPCGFNTKEFVDPEPNGLKKIRIKVVDADTGEGVPSVTVTLKGQREKVDKDGFVFCKTKNVSASNDLCKEGVAGKGFHVVNRNSLPNNGGNIINGMPDTVTKDTTLKGQIPLTTKGLVTLEVPIGIYNLEIAGDDYELYDFAKQKNSVFVIGQNEWDNQVYFHEISIRKTNRNSVLTVEAVDKEGKAVEGAQVVLKNKDSTFYFKAAPESAKGLYRGMVPDGIYHVSVFKDGYEVYDYFKVFSRALKVVGVKGSQKFNIDGITYDRIQEQRVILTRKESFAKAISSEEGGKNVEETN